MASDSYLIYSEDGSTLRSVANSLETAESLDLLLSADAARQSLLSEFTYESSARRNPSDNDNADMFLEAQEALREAAQTALIEKNQEIRSALAKFGVEDASLLTKKAFKGYKSTAMGGVPKEERGDFAKQFALVEQMYEERRALIVVFIQTSLFPELHNRAALPVRDISFFEELKRLLLKGYTPASIQDLANAVDPSVFVERETFSDAVPTVPEDALDELTKGLDSLMPFLELIEPLVAQNNASNLRNFLRQMTSKERKAFTAKFLGKEEIAPVFVVDHAVAPRLMWTLAAFRLGELESLSSSFSADENSFIAYYQGESPGIEYVVAALHYMDSGEMEKPFDKKSRVLEKPPERAGDAFKNLLAEFGYSVEGNTKTAEACRVAASIALGGSVALNYAMGRKTPPVDKLYDKILVVNSGGVRLGGAEMFEALVEAEYETLEEYTLTVMLYCFGFLKQVRETAFSYATDNLPISNATEYRKFLADKLSNYFSLDAEKSLTINESELEALAREIRRYVSDSGDAQKMVEVFGDTPAYWLQTNNSTFNVWEYRYESLTEYPKLWALFQSKPGVGPNNKQIWILDFVAHCAVCCIAAELLYFRKNKSFSCATFLNTASISNVEDPVECWKLNTFNPLNLFCGHSSISACCLVPYGAGGTAAMRGALTNKENFVLFYFRERKLFAGLTAEFLLTAESDALIELKDQIVEKVEDYPESFVSGLPQLSVFKKPKPAALTKILSKKISESGVMQFDGMEGKSAAALPEDLEGVAGNQNVSVINAVAERIDALLYTSEVGVSPALSVQFEGEEAKPEAYIDHDPASGNLVPLTAIGFEEVVLAPLADSVTVHLEDKGFGSFEIQSLSYYKNERLVLEPKPEETLNLIVALAYPFFAKVFPLNAKNVVLNLSNTATTYAESKRLLEEVAKKFFKPEWLLKDRNGSIRGKSIAETLRERTPESLTILAEGGHTEVVLPS